MLKHPLVVQLFILLSITFLWVAGAMLIQPSASAASQTSVVGLPTSRVAQATITTGWVTSGTLATVVPAVPVATNVTSLPDTANSENWVTPIPTTHQSVSNTVVIKTTPESIHTPSSTSSYITGVVNRNANLRAGPGVEYELVGRVKTNQPVKIVASNKAGDWYRLDSGAWIAAFLVSRVAGHVPVLPSAELPTAIPTTRVPVSTASAANGIARPKIKTALGEFVITEVVLSDRFPPDCQLGTPFCNQVESGYQVLTAWLDRVDKTAPVSAMVNLLNSSHGVYVIATDGSKTERFSGGLLHGRFLVAFTPKVTAHNFTLYWPDNSPIPLGK